MSFGNSQTSDLRILKSNIFIYLFLTGQDFTCVMSSVHSSVVVTHGVQVVQIVEGKDQIRRLLLSA